MKGDFQLTLKPVLFQGLMKEFPEKIKKAGFEGIDQIANKSKRQISSLTPGKVLPKGWVIKKQGNKFGRTRLLVNSDPRAYKVVQLSGDRQTNLMEMLEYGTREHEIVPVKAEALRFVIDGETIYTKHVDHPGTKPYAFASTTLVTASMEVARLQNKLAAMLKQGIS